MSVEAHPTQAGAGACAGPGSGAAPVRRWLVLAICCSSLFLVTLDVTIVNLALPAIGRDLALSTSGLSWTIDAYSVVLASFLIVAGATADRVGRKRVFQLGLACFGAGSLLCSAAPSLELLAAFRALQALGGSMMNPVAMSILVNVFTEPAARARAIGIWGGVVGLSMAVGPLAGGLLVETLGWRAIFWMNVPLAAAAIALTRRFVPESRAAQPRRPDLVGLVLVVIALGALTTCLIEGRGAGWSSPPIVGGLALSAAAVAALLRYERRRAEPLLELRFFRSLPFSLATVLAVLSFALFNGALFLSSLTLQLGRGLSPVAAGLRLLPIAGGLVVFSQLSGWLVGKGQARWALLGAGLALLAAALCALDGSAQISAGVSAAAPEGQLLLSFALLGVGFGLVNAPITTAAVTGMPRAQAGVAAAIASTSRQVGTALGVAIAGAIAGAGSAPGGAATFSPLATRPFWWLASAGGLAIAGLGLLATSRRARRSASAWAA